LDQGRLDVRGMDLDEATARGRIRPVADRSQPDRGRPDAWGMDLDEAVRDS
jgi:hypothetical protein